MTEQETQNVKATTDALELMLSLRNSLHRGKGWDVLNAACNRLTDRAWAELGEERPILSEKTP